MILLQSIQTDFVLTTLATRQQSKIFPQHIAPETPGSTFAMCFSLRNKSRFIFICLHVFVEKGKAGKKPIKNKDAKTCLIPRIIFSGKTKCRCYPGRETQEFKKKTGKSKNMCFSLFYNHVSFFFMCFISFMYSHFYSFLAIFCHCCSFPVFCH